jgi:hypothetical protein
MIIGIILAIIFFYAQFDTYQYDYITAEQFWFREASAALYIAFSVAVVKALGNIKESQGYGNKNRR